MSNYPVVLTGLESGAVVGGGEVAARKVQGLLAAGVRVTVISPQLAPELQELAAQARISILPRPYRPGDLADVRLVIAATGDPQVNQAVWQEAQARGCLVNVVDDPAHCTFHVPAVVRRGPVTISIGTGGASPALAKWLRRHISADIGPEYEQLAVLLAELRTRVQSSIPVENRQALWRELINSLLPLLREGSQDGARQAAESILQRVQEFAVVTAEKDPAN
jgi:precorrin-2 dehydrogenase